MATKTHHMQSLSAKPFGVNSVLRHIQLLLENFRSYMDVLHIERHVTLLGTFFVVFTVVLEMRLES